MKKKKNNVRSLLMKLSTLTTPTH